MNRTILLLIILASFTTSSFAQGRIVIDRKSAAQATANGVAATAQEELIRSEFRVMNEEQNKVKNMVVMVEQHLNKVEKIQQDISAFKKEGAAIKLFAFKTKKATSALSDLSKEIFSRPQGVAASYKEMFSLSNDIYGICRDMVGTVIDGKFALPGFEKQKQVQVKQQLNFLEPQERLAFYNRCNYEMDLIIFKIRQMQMSIICNDNLDNVFLKVAPLTYVNNEYGKQIANDIINLWEK